VAKLPEGAKSRLKLVHYQLCILTSAPSIAC
jgi:hypothetical protein